MTMLTLPRLFLALSLGVSLAAAQAPDSGVAEPDTAQVALPATSEALAKTSPPAPDNAEAEELLRSGNSLVVTGTVVAVGGLLISTVSSTAGVPALGLVGSLGQIIGIPVLGVGAGRINHAAEMINPAYQPNYRGWGWYWGSLALDGVATYFVIQAFNEADDAETEDEQEEKLLEGILIALPFAIASRVCFITSWVKFTKLANEGRRAYRGEATSSLQLAPDLKIARDGHAAPGLRLSYRF